MGVGNAFGNTANNLIGIWQYQNMMNPQSSASPYAPATSIIPPVRRI